MEVALVGGVVLVLFIILIMNAGTGRCRQCRKRVSVDAKVCPYCGNDFTQAETPEAPAA